jgi:GNAT superfamily N-acetyltransferase
MKITVTDFDPAKHLDAAAQLLAARHTRDRQREPRFPALYEAAEPCKAVIQRSFDTPNWKGVLAEAGGRPVGFATMTPQLIEATHFLASFFPPRGVALGYGAHATADGMEYDVYREMFGALADHFVSKGFFDYNVAVPAKDVEAREAFASLGFGRSMCCAIRGVDPVDRAAASVELHQASAEDVDVVHTLSDELTLHHARSPIFNPFIRESDQAAVDFQKNLLNDAAANAHWVAYDKGKPVGMNTFMQPFFLSPMTVPEKTVYLFQGIVTEDARTGGVGSAILSQGVAWARDQGYQHVALHFATANLSGAKFWQSSGFIPVEYGLRRRVDDRIAWANR